MSELCPALIVMSPDSLGNVYPPELCDRIAKRVTLLAPPISAGALVDATNTNLLGDVEVLLTGWGVPRMDAKFLAAAPNLRAVFHGAGSVRSFVTDAVWERELVVTSAAAANAVPVAQFCQAQVFLLLKRAYALSRAYRGFTGNHGTLREGLNGAVGTRVGLISFGLIGRLVCEMLRPHGIEIVVYDPYLPEDDATTHGVERVDLETLFVTSDVVSLHTPLLDETRGMIRGKHFRAMRSGAGFINTARGAVVNEEEMCAVLAERPDLTAVLDVTYPEPPLADSPLWSLPNAVVTPHVAGALGRECGRLGEHAVTQMVAYLEGRPMEGLVTRASFARMA